MLQFAPFEPDKASFNPGAAGERNFNALPVADGWGPMPSLIPYSDALPAQCYGATYVRDSDGAFFLIAATQTSLYRLTGTSWTNITGPTSLSVPDNDRVRFIRFGNRLIVTALGAVPQYLDVDLGGNFADLPNAPQAKYGCVAGDFLVLGHLANDPYKLQWSGINDSEFWTPGLRGSDFQILPDGDEITGLFGAPSGAAIFQRNTMREMAFNPTSGYTFTISVVHATRGSLAPQSIVQIGPGDFMFLCQDGWFRGWGTNTTAIGAEKVDRWFFGSVNTEDLAIVRCVADPFQKIVWAQFPSTTGLSYNLLGYKWTLDRWCNADNAGVTELVSIVTQAATIDSITDIIDTVDIAIDSRFFKGGTPIFAGFTIDLKLAIFDGAPQQATLATAEIELAAPDRAFINGVRVYADTADLWLEIGKRDYLGGPQSLSPIATPSSVTGLIPTRVSTRLAQFIVNIRAGAEWSHCVGLDPAFIPEGKR